jgi:heptosyltransferase-2
MPALRLLRERWPTAQIELVGNARAAQLGLVAGLLDIAHSLSEARWAQLYGSASLASELQSWLDHFDLIVSFWPDPEQELRRHFAHRGPNFIASDAHVITRPGAAHFCNALKPLGLTTTDFLFRIEFPEAIRTEARQRLAGLEHFIAIHPGSGSPQKNWPADRWVEFAALLRRPVLVIVGEAESEPINWPKTAIIHHARDWPLPVLGAVLAQSAMFVGHDSGVSHLAAAAGARCVLLFGPTDPAIWAPPGVHVLQCGATWDAIKVRSVVAAVDA